jgi:cell wall-associated NlpC family hydrolase
LIRVVAGCIGCPGKYFLAICLTLFLSAGGAFAADAKSVADLDRFPQEASAYLPADADEPIVSYEDQTVYSEEYLRNHFAPWNSEDLSYLGLTFEKITSFHRAMAKKKYYSADGKPYPAASMNKIADNGKINPDTAPRPAVALADADVRILPTSTPLFNSRAAARGERGLLKMDAMQNSVIKPGEPLAVFGASGDLSWLFIATGTVVGWIRSNSAAFVDADFIDRWTFQPHYVVLKDNIRVEASDGKRLCTLKLGSILPGEGGELLVPARGENGMAVAQRLRLEPGTFAEFPVPFTPRNAAGVVDELMGEPYGWGGMNGFRDCSAMTRDYFAVFGAWLPRNSGDQARTGASIPLGNIAVDERPRTIVENAVPYATLIHMPGHIMLYLGLYDSEPVVFHNVWGVRVNAKGGVGRTVIGRAVVSSLRAGEEIANRPETSLFIDRIASLAFPIETVAY